MLNTYRAILRGQLLEWLSDKPVNLPLNRPVTVHVTILEETPSSKKQQGRRMAAALEKLAKLSSTKR